MFALALALIIFFQILGVLVLLSEIYLLIINFPVFIFFGSPYVSTPKKEIKAILELANPKDGEVLYDLGSGDGRILIEAAKNYNLKAIGIEINPFLVLWSSLKIKKFGLSKKVKIHWGNFFKKDLSQANIVVVYLLQSTLNKLEKKLLSELKPGTRIVSKSFTLKKIPFIKSHFKYPSLRLYQIPQN